MLSILGTGKIAERTHSRSSLYELIISRPADVRYTLSQVFPYLTEKQSAAAAVLDHLKSARAIVVDPKHFDPQSFVDFSGSECVIPPNSFVLAGLWSISASRAMCSQSVSASLRMHAVALSSM